MIFLPISVLYAQQNQTINKSKDTLNLYLDCDSCDENHIRSELFYINYVRDPQQGNIHLFITEQETGDGGEEYELSFIGRGRFSGINYTYKQLVSRNATNGEVRDQITEFIEKGLLPFAMQTPVSSRFTLDYNDNGDSRLTNGISGGDPWNHWVFEAYVGGIDLDLESNQKEFESRWGFYADRVTENWKIRVRPFFNYTYEEIQHDENEDPIHNRQHDHGLESYLINSINQHWSVGLFGDYETINSRNLNHRFFISPGIEYSVYPYSVATRKSITLTYQIGYSYVNYYEETIYNKLRESLFNQELKASVEIQQPWGSISSGLIGSHYLHDFSKRSAEFFGEISVRIWEGLSLNFSTSFEMINDQLSLPVGNTSLEDVLLQRKELATEFEFSGSIAISYTFGSEFANVVNTRF
ncbi:MAG: hypothetical protein WEA36_07865 [Balneolaceae bacterium]